MGHFAQVNDKNRVTQVVVADDDQQEWLETNLGGVWVQTSYNTRGGEHILGSEPFRKNYAGIGYTYDEDRDAFIPPKPFESWVLDETTCLWVAPVPMPEETDEEGNPVPYVWDESAGEWVVSE